MTNLLGKFILTIVVISILGFGFLLAYEPWFKLSKDFGSSVEPPEKILEQQSCILGNTNIGGFLNIGIAEQKLYLSHKSPLSYIIKPLLIELNAITKIEPCVTPFLNSSYKFFIGEPNITTLILSQELIEKLEKDYGETIFSNELEQLS
ncbi:conserved hypothetical protein [Hyella patelloides LEGE 07179]|uniref:Uncharacterized protein n=1 Tax=Hyella patelloides LEGE 07179 TaxID=945734 RepID=A0A563VWJ5_9CYAN|nr:hypothetical protein [Hyella patelloides]VEP15623.1 conserved hypothetical protein [Hyella patelloides LEGE 07179]